MAGRDWIPQAALVALLLIPATDGFSWPLLVLGVILGLLSIPLILQLRLKSYPWSLWLLGIFLKWAFVAAIFSTNLQDGLIFSTIRASLMLSFFLWGHQMGKAELHRYVMLIFLGIGLFSLSQFAGMGKASSLPFFPDTNLLSAAWVLLLPSAFVKFREEAGISAKLGWGIILGIGFVSVLVFQSRGAWMGLAVLLAIAPIFLFQMKWKKLAWLIFVLVGGWLALQSGDKIGGKIGEKIGSITDTESNFSNRERLMRWTIALRMCQAEPMTGIGPGQYPKEFKFWLQNREEVERISYWHGWRLGAHNDSLTILAETGLPAALAWLALLGLSIWNAAWNPKKRAILLSMLAFALMTCFNDLLDSGFIMAILALNLGAAAKR